MFSMQFQAVFPTMGRVDSSVKHEVLDSQYKVSMLLFVWCKGSVVHFLYAQTPNYPLSNVQMNTLTNEITF